MGIMADLSSVKKIAVVGSGIMGTGIMEGILLKGFDKAVLHDADSSALRKGRDTIERMIRIVADEEGFKQFVSSYAGMNAQHSRDFDALRKDPKIVGMFAEGATADDILGRLVCEEDLEKAVSDVDFVIEAVSEVLELKQDVFEKLSELAPAHAVCASNTSTLPVTKIALKSKRPENAIGMHFHGFTQIINRLVEIMGGEKTAEGAMELGRLVGASLPSLGGERLAVRLDREAEGFIANRIAAPAGIYGTWFMDKAMAEGISLEQLHAAGRNMIGTDIVGLDTAYNAGISYQQNLSPDFSPSKAITELVKQGRLGRKTGRGIYEWDESGNVVIKEVEVEEKTREFIKAYSDPEIAMAARLNEACRLIELGVVKGCSVVTEVERIGESHEGIFVLGADKYKEWAEKLEEVAERIGKPYLKPCEMMKSGKFKDYP